MIFNRIIILTLVIVCFFSCSNINKIKKDKLIFRISNDYLVNTDTIYVEIVNLSANNFFLPIDWYHKKFNPKLNPHYNSNFYPSIIIEEQPYSNIIKYSDDLISTDYNPFQVISDFVLIDAKSTTNIKIPFSNKEILPNHKFSYIDRGLTKGVYRMCLEYNISKNDVESIINPELLNLLYEKGYQCYDGTITSNVVKLVVE